MGSRMGRRLPKWTMLWEDPSSGGKFIRQVGIKSFQIIEWIDMDDACGRDNEGQPRYVVDLGFVDLSKLSTAQIEGAMESCGFGRDMVGDLNAIAEACHSYGYKAPLWSTQTNARVRGIAEAKREANALLDSDAFRARMQRPVNKVGSTADECMRGDFESAVDRGMLRGDPTCLLVGKIEGKQRPWRTAKMPPTSALVEPRPEDWLPYLFGYMAGVTGQPREAGDDLAQSYKDGYKRGVAVRSGLATPPSWIKS